MKERILEVLAEKADTFMSGEELSKELGVTRAAIWKVMKALKEDGYDIESVNRKGYRLMSSPDIISAAEMELLLKGTMYSSRIHYQDSLSSTSDLAKKMALEEAPSGTLCMADEQTAGRGRLGRSWQSQRGSGIWMSLLLRPTFAPNHASKITQLAAVSVVEAIRESCGVEAGIKWPNDVILNSKKVCGILTEMNAELNAINYIVVGIGINVSGDDFGTELEDKATSVRKEVGETPQRKVLAALILRKFERYYLDYVEGGQFGPLIDKCRAYSVTLGKKVVITGRDSTLEGVAVELNEDGELVVETATGQRETIYYGEVSVRGINGYI